MILKGHVPTPTPPQPTPASRSQIPQDWSYTATHAKIYTTSPEADPDAAANSIPRSTVHRRSLPAQRSAPQPALRARSPSERPVEAQRVRAGVLPVVTPRRD